VTAGFISLGIPGTGAETGGGANTTLSADVAARASSIHVASATGIAAGDFLRIGDVGETEIRQVDASYVAGTTIPLATLLGRAHDSGDQVREVDDAGAFVGAEDVWDAEWSGFAYVNHKQVTALLGTGLTATANATLQEGAKGYREATLVFTAPDSATKDAVRAFDESSEAIEFTDYDATIRSVRVLTFEASLTVSDLWRVSVRLQELTEPV
jgi:hypothetical protein